jgi:hypothetical protein
MQFGIGPRPPMGVGSIPSLGDALVYGASAVGSSIKDIGNRLQGGLLHASAPLVGAVHGTGAFEEQLRRGDLAMAGEDPGRSPDELLESVIGSGMPGMDPVLVMEHLPAFITALRGGRRLTIPERQAFMLKEITIPEGTGSVTRITPKGEITVNIGGRTVDSHLSEVQRLLEDTTHATPEGLAMGPMDPINAPALRGATEAVSTAPEVRAATGSVPSPSPNPASETVSRLFGTAVADITEGVRTDLETVLGPRGMAWFSSGRKGGIGGDEFAAEVQRLQGRIGNIPGLAKGEGNRIRNAFSAIDQNPKEAYDAVYENLFYGTEVPEAIRAKYGDALPALRRSLSDLSEIHATLKSIDPAVIEQYPVWLKRFIQEPLESRALRGGGAGAGAVPGLAPISQRMDAYALSASNMSVKEAKEVIDAMPPELRPLQPAAPGMSKGLVTGKDNPEWVGKAFGDYGRADLKWPDTPEGRRGRDLFRKRVESSPMYRERNIEFTVEDPIPSPSAQLEKHSELYDAGRISEADDPVTHITDLPTLLSRSYADVLRRKANEEFFATLPGMVDSTNGQSLTKFIPAKSLRNKDALDNLAKEGYEVMRGSDFTGPLGTDRRWGILNAAEEEGVKGVYAVRSNVAAYLKESEKTQNALAQATHGFLDSWAINATNAPKTGFMNWLYNKILIDPMNGNFPGSSHLKRGRDLVRSWESTGVMPEELRAAAQKGLPLLAPEKGMSSVDDVVDNLFSDAVASRSASYDTGKRIYEAVGASPLAENPLEAAAGGFIQGGLRGVTEGHGPIGIIGEAALGAAETTALRKPAQWMREKYVNSDLFTTVGAYLKHYDDALKEGLVGDAAITKAVNDTIDLTQAGQWSRVGGFSEALGAAPSGIAGAQHSTGRAIQKAFLNRFIKFSEVDARLKMNALKRGGKTAIGAGLGAATIYGLKEGGRKAGESMGIITPEESAFMDNALPEAVFVPVWDRAKGQPGMVSFPGKSVGVPLADVPDDWREALSQVTGPAFVSTVEMVGGDKGASLLTGAPLRMKEPHEGTTEDALEANVRSEQQRWQSPWASTGRYAGMLRDMGADALEPVPEKTPPTVPMMAASAVLGPVRDADPKVLKDQNIRAFHAQRQEIEKEGNRAEKAAVPSMKAEGDKQAMERVADLAEEYLRKGLTMDELGLKWNVRQALSQRGWGR